jgi:hypothetical protein
MRPLRYSEWLEFHLLSGLGNASYRLGDGDGNGTIVLVGSLRMRQVRSGGAGRRSVLHSHSHPSSRPFLWMARLHRRAGRLALR